MGRRSTTALLIAIGLAVGLSVAAYFYALPSPGDDTFIYMRYVANAIAGHGFVYNIGEESFGVTSPLWAFLMVPIAAVFGNSVQTWQVASAIVFALRVVLTFFLTFGLSKGNLKVATLVTLMANIESYTFRWCATGMENSFYMLALAGIAWLHFTDTLPKKARNMAFGALLGATPFVRPELSLVGGMVALFEIVTEKERVSIDTLFSAALATAVALAGMTFVCFGGFLPATAQAKALLLPMGPKGIFDAGVQFSLLMLATGSGGALIPLVAIKAEDAQSRGWKFPNLVAIAIVVAYLGWANQMMTTRYATQISGVATFAAAVLIAWFVGRQDKLPKWIAACCGAQLVAAVAVLSFMFPSTQINQLPAIKDFADYMQANSPKDARIALSEIGMFGYLLDRYLIDTIGLVDPATVEWAKKNGRPVEDQQHLDRYLIARKATYYIDTSGQGDPIKGEELSYELIKKGPIPRTKSGNGISTSEWRLYRLSVKP